MTKDDTRKLVVETSKVVSVDVRQQEQPRLGCRNGDFGYQRSGKEEDVFGPRGGEAVHPNEGELEQVTTSMSATYVVSYLR